MTTVVAMGSDKEMIEIEDDDEDVIDEEQLDEYREMIDQLGSFPDKVKINSLTMVAEDHADSKASAKAIYEVIKQRLLKTHPDNMLPLVYVLDSILKNVKGAYIPIVEADAETWLSTVHRQLAEPQKQKLQKVWRTWLDCQLFSPASLKIMGRSFDERASEQVTGAVSKVAGISRTGGGGLLLSAKLRREMQSILDEMQSDIDNELDKVSLERLADLNPNLLAEIKATAEQNLRSETSTQPQEDAALPAFFTETRSEQVLDRSKAWHELKWNYREQTHDVVTKLQHELRDGVSAEARYTQQQALDMTQFLAAASATASILTETMERIKNQEDQKDNKRRMSFPGLDGAMSLGTSHAVDPSLFTTRGIRQRNDAVVALLYDVGLPFLSSADGRRFATQIELSNHLDALFQRNQLEKSIARTEERGWMVADAVWTRDSGQDQAAAATESTATEPTAATDTDDGYHPQTSTMPADELRDRCVICGINFKMFFDNDEGMYRYSNCREIQVLNDDAAERESEDMLVHVTCWRGLGSPQVLTMDQALQETLRP